MDGMRDDVEGEGMECESQCNNNYSNLQFSLIKVDFHCIRISICCTWEAYASFFNSSVCTHKVYASNVRHTEYSNGA